jgi:hypothetical protein
LVWVSYKRNESRIVSLRIQFQVLCRSK